MVIKGDTLLVLPVKTSAEKQNCLPPFIETLFERDENSQKKQTPKISGACLKNSFCKTSINALRTGKNGGLLPYHISYVQQHAGLLLRNRQLSMLDEGLAQSKSMRG